MAGLAKSLADYCVTSLRQFFICKFRTKTWRAAILAAHWDNGRTSRPLLVRTRGAPETLTFALQRVNLERLNVSCLGSQVSGPRAHAHFAVGGRVRGSAKAPPGRRLSQLGVRDGARPSPGGSAGRLAPPGAGALWRGVI